MKIVIGCLYEYKEFLKEYEDYLIENSIDYIIYLGEDIYDLSLRVILGVLDNKDINKGIIIDDFGISPFMIAGKINGIICAEMNDEHSSLMTRDHNNANVITLGCEILGKGIINSILERYTISDFAAGRHQVRIDMLNKMGGDLNENRD